jgi:RNA polymerase-interacting CarD/CdnL/TRCF family regulator
MGFKVGDVVVHRAYGPGEIVQLDKKSIAGVATDYYVLQVGDMTLFVPRSDQDQASLRPLTPASDFDRMFTILQKPGEPLSPDRMERRTQLMESMKDGKLESICRVIRDLSDLSRTKKLNDNDGVIYERAQRFLLMEWKIALNIPLPEAQRNLSNMLSMNVEAPAQ